MTFFWLFFDSMWRGGIHQSSLVFLWRFICQSLKEKICLKRIYYKKNSGVSCRKYLMTLSHRGINSEYWMIYRGPGFLRSYDLAPPPPPLSSASCISFSVGRRSSLQTGDGEGGAKSYYSEKAWSPLNHSILSGDNVCFFFFLQCIWLEGIREEYE